MTGGSGSDVLLVMPPVSEAVQFPYLALPQLTAAWTAQGYGVVCCDLNLRYRAAALRRSAASGRPGSDDAGPGSDDGRPASDEGGPPPPAKDMFRRLSERYREQHGQLLLDRSRDRTSGFDQEVAIRAAVRYVTQQAARDGWILPGPILMSRLDELVRAGTEGWSARWSTEHLEGLLDAHRPRVIAFSVPFFSQLVPTLALCTLLKRRRPELRTMVGGPTVQMWEKALRHKVAAARHVDDWCLGHGEDYLAKVLGAPAAGPLPSTPQPEREPQPGPVPEPEQRAAGLSDGFVLNDQPMPDFGQFDFDDYSNQAHQFPYRLTLGCFWGKCTFCSYGNRYLDARAFQQIDPRKAAAHLVALAARLGITDVAVTDENTGLRHLLRVMQAVRDRGASLTFRVRARLEPELADPEFCKRLYDLGCVQMSAGYETAQQDILDSLRKGQDARHAELAVGNLTAAGITINLSFMDGFAHPAAAEGYRETVRTIQRHPEDMGLDTMQLLVAEPGSHLWESRRAGPDDEYLITNEGLAFAAGRVGGALLDGTATEEARQRLLRMAVEAVPDAERASRPDLVRRPEAAGGNGPAPVAATAAGARARPRFGVALDAVRDRWFLADVAWPRMAAVPPGVERTAGGRLTAEGPEGRLWLSHMVEKRLLVLDQPEAEGVS
ncbi:B12-binding domain-containing radical SAM protein [Streptomyces sp. NPDC058674]|uniref:B12-binding domain-containing radical SAM protein n=1 Tax=Streptomyces sp. NPDC058674 TaxID=3346592 RepID=UPI00366931BE